MPPAHVASPYKNAHEALRDSSALTALEFAADALGRYVEWAKRQAVSIALADLCAIRQHVYVPVTTSVGKWYLVDIEPLFVSAESPNITAQLDTMRRGTII